MVRFPEKPGQNLIGAVKHRYTCVFSMVRFPELGIQPIAVCTHFLILISIFPKN